MQAHHRQCGGACANANDIDCRAAIDRRPITKLPISINAPTFDTTGCWALPSDKK
jgi:hypothetical protein